ncbi:hypothetical protein [Longimicrobium sp.]|uniref:hypothetical protein n=1 Tax=Longimicrobium sp. TaxID=2029185 RepID=UPI003B3A4A69
MQKLNLELLAVETFQTSDAGGTLRGTVRGHAWSYYEPTCTFATSAPDMFCAAACDRRDARMLRGAAQEPSVPRG